MHFHIKFPLSFSCFFFLVELFLLPSFSAVISTPILLLSMCFNFQWCLVSSPIVVGVRVNTPRPEWNEQKSRSNCQEEDTCLYTRKVCLESEKHGWEWNKLKTDDRLVFLAKHDELFERKHELWRSGTAVIWVLALLLLPFMLLL